MNDFLKCQRCDYKQKRSRLVVKCVFLSVIFCILSFILGVAVGGSFDSKTANRSVVSASAAESTSTVSKWNPDWVQAPADWNQYGDLYNQVNLEEFSSLWEQRFASLYLDSYNITYQQTLNENYISIEGIAKDNFSDFTVYFPFSELYDYVVNDNMLFIYGLRVENVLGASFSEWGCCLSDFSFISTSGSDVPLYASALGSGNYYLGFAFDALDVGAPFSIRIRNIQLSCYLSSTEVSSVPRGYITPFSYVCDYYYNLGLDTVPGGGYTEEDLQAEYDRGYAEGDSAGYDRGYQAGLEVVDQDSYNAGYEAGFSAAVSDLTDNFFYDIDFYMNAYFPQVNRQYPMEKELVDIPLVQSSYYSFSGFSTTLISNMYAYLNSIGYDVASMPDDALLQYTEYWSIRFSRPISISSLESFRFSTNSDFYTTMFLDPVFAVLSSGERVSLSYVPTDYPPAGALRTSYLLDLSNLRKNYSNSTVVSLDFETYHDTRVGYPENVGTSFLEIYDSFLSEFDTLSYNAGYDEGLKKGKEFASSTSYKNGYDQGYAVGISKAEKFDFTLAVSTVLGAPVSVVRDFLNFELLGVNLLSFITGVITLLVIVKCIKFFV